VGHGDTVLQYRLKCARVTLPEVVGAIQHFEHGHMVYMDTSSLEDNSQYSKRIYVLYDDGTVPQPLVDYYYGEQYEPTPPPIPSPPAGLIAPKLGFGKVWKEHEDIRKRLGYATGPEVAVSNNDLQLFARGFMVSDGRRIYAEYISFGFGPVRYGWEAFDLPQTK
jgi:hypothetical protein